MKVERNLFFLLVPFFYGVGLIYGFWEGWRDMVGPFGLLLTGTLCLMVAFYLHVTGRRYADRPEDDPSATIDSVEGDYGFFIPSSWWPLWLGAAAAVCFAGLAVGWWLFAIGATFGIVALVGWSFEAFTSKYAQ